jgi:phosphoadenosine phosphosulfate reductase
MSKPKSYTAADLAALNHRLRKKTPQEIVAWAIEMAKKSIVTTNFGPYGATILHVCTQARKDIDVIWCDTGYNTPQTYRHAETLIAQLELNIDVYVPKQTTAYRNAVMGIPSVDDPLHEKFTEEVKLEPFRRAMAAHQPDVWFANLRKGQTAFRDNLDIVSQNADGVLKISPFYRWDDNALDAYLKKYQLPNEFKYFDPTKVLDNRECGLHLC